MVGAMTAGLNYGSDCAEPSDSRLLPPLWATERPRNKKKLKIRAHYYLFLPVILTKRYTESETGSRPKRRLMRRKIALRGVLEMQDSIVAAPRGRLADADTNRLAHLA